MITPSGVTRDTGASASLTSSLCVSMRLKSDSSSRVPMHLAHPEVVMGVVGELRKNR